MKVNALRCHFERDGENLQGLVNELNKIGYENVLNVLCCCPSDGYGEVYYTIIYKEDDIK
jgi:hypothetical protein